MIVYGSKSVATLHFCVLLCLLLAMPRSTRAEEASKLKLIIDNLRQNELIYESIDVEVACRYTLGPREPTVLKMPGNRTVVEVTKSAHAIHFVEQGSLFRLDIDGTSTSGDGPEENRDRIRAFDGETTRLYDRRAIGNLIKGRSIDDNFIMPHMMLLHAGSGAVKRTVHLSTYLSGHEVMKAHPDGHWNESLLMSVTYEGEDIYDGLKCQKVRVQTSNKSGAQVSRRDLWLAEDRNYLPVRSVGYRYVISKNQPVGEGNVIEMREIRPGIWFPGVTQYECVDQSLLARSGERKLGWRSEYVTKKVSLEPNYPKTYFQDVKFPVGTPVYEVENGEIKRSYVTGAPGGGAGQSIPARSRFVLLNIGLVAAIGVGWALKRKVRNTRLTKRRLLQSDVSGQ